MSLNSDLSHITGDDEMIHYATNIKFQGILSEIAQGTETIEINPQQPDFNFESNRLKSFHSWSNKYVLKEKLARFGFYYFSASDDVKCVFCEVVIRKWRIGDDPLSEHYKHSQNCVFINLQNTINVPLKGELLVSELKEFQESSRRKKFNKDLLPRHPDYKDENIRLQSFKHWPKCMPQTKEELSAAGFFYRKIGDQVKCFKCAGCLTEWEEDDSPIEEHKKHFGEKCQFIKKNYTRLKRIYATTPKLKKKQASPAQIAKLKKFMNKHPDLKEDKLRFGNKQLYIQLWKELTELLNSIKGPNKTTKMWKEVWRNHKCNSKRKGTKKAMQPFQNQSNLKPSRIEPPINQNLDFQFEEKTSDYESSASQNNLTMEHHTTELQLSVSDNIAIESQAATQSLELQLSEKKSQNKRLQMEIEKLELEKEYLELQQHFNSAKQELERTRLQTTEGLTYLNL